MQHGLAAADGADRLSALRREARSRRCRPALSRFLDDGPPPVVFFTGTGIRHAASVLRAPRSRCAGHPGRRGVLLSSFAENFKATLPPFIHAEAYAPFSQLLPRAAAFFHHGGIGSIAQALAAGTPQIAVPSAFDQADNGARIERLGVGVVVPPRQVQRADAVLQRSTACSSEDCRARLRRRQGAVCRRANAQQTADLDRARLRRAPPLSGVGVSCAARPARCLRRLPLGGTAAAGGGRDVAQDQRVHLLHLVDGEVADLRIVLARSMLTRLPRKPGPLVSAPVVA